MRQECRTSYLYEVTPGVRGTLGYQEVTLSASWGDHSDEGTIDAERICAAGMPHLLFSGILWVQGTLGYQEVTLSASCVDCSLRG